MKTNFSRARVFSSIFVLLLGMPATGASPRDELLRLVPDDMTFCTIVQDVRERAKNNKPNSLLARTLQLPFVRAKMESPEFKKLLDIQMQVLKDLQLTPEQLRDDLIGDAVIFAYRRGPTGKPEQDQGLFLVWARDEALLVRVVERVNEIQTKTGELKELKTFVHRGQSYNRRSKGKNPAAESEFYFVRDHMLVFSPQESLLKTAIERLQRDDKQPLFWAKMLEQLGVNKSLLVLMINPRAFDTEFESREKVVKGEERAFLQEFRKYWQAFEGLAIYSDIAENFEIGFAANVRKVEFPVAAQRFFAEFAKPSTLWKIIPDDCLFAISSRLDPSLLAEMVSGFCDDNRLKEVSKALSGSLGPFLPNQGKLNTIMKGLGPDWGFWAFAPATVDKTWVPQCLLAVQVRDSTEGAATDTAVRKAVQFLATMAQFSAQDQLRVDTTKQDGLEMTSLTHDSLPPGVRPAFASKDGFLLFAGSPETIRRFVPPGKGVLAASETPLMRMSATGWQRYLSTCKNEIAEFISKTSGTTAKDTGRQIEAIIENLQPFDRLEIVVRSKADRATVAVRLSQNQRR